VSSSFVPTTERKYRFFQNVHVTSDGIAVVKFDNPEKKVNTISFALKEEAEKLWQTDIQSRIPSGSVRAVVFTSAKPDCFVAGADIFDIQTLEDKTQLIPLIESATHFFQHALKGKHKGSSSSIPLVCAIDGPALGAGLGTSAYFFTIHFLDGTDQLTT
jgi:enoyl-CoA hydratase/carnithine racemase